jgi:hypothetical protein
MSHERRFFNFKSQGLCNCINFTDKTVGVFILLSQSVALINFNRENSLILMVYLQYFDILN